MKEINVTKENFDAEVISSDTDVLVDFWATWCGPCRMLAPILSEIADEGKIKVCKVNVDEEPELADRFRIEAIPAVYAFRKGKNIGKNIGYTDKETLLALLK